MRRTEHFTREEKRKVKKQLRIVAEVYNYVTHKYPLIETATKKLVYTEQLLIMHYLQTRRE